jgi:cardiolipin synthase C
MIKTALCALLVAAFCLGGCASIPKDAKKEPSCSLEKQPDTKLGRAFSGDIEQHPGLSGFHIFPADMEGFITRALLIDAAQKSLDLQYFEVDDDNITVNVIIEKLLAAADRGVRVRLLFDDIGTTLKDSELWLLASHPNIEVRIFNPIKKRTPGAERSVETAADFRRIDHRMHNKAFIADSSIGIVGGRNLGDQYFGANEKADFSDMDLMVIGPIVKDISRSFDVYYNCKWAIPYEWLSSQKPDDAELKKCLNELKEKNIKAKESKYAVNLEQSDFLSRIEKGDIPFSWAKGTVLYDLPEKASEKKDKKADVFLINSLLPLVKGTKSEVLLISPYFVPGKRGTELLGKLSEQGIKVKVLTNSLASTDELSVEAGYTKYRKPLIEKGVELFELRSDSDRQEASIRTKYTGSSGGGLHAKYYVFDRKAAFIGSRNLDNRSNRINTEIGIFVESPEIAAYAAHIFDAGTVPENAYRLRLSKDGNVEWITQENGKEVIYDNEPNTTFWQRLGADLLAIFIPESEL